MGSGSGKLTMFMWVEYYEELKTGELLVTESEDIKARQEVTDSLICVTRCQ